MRRVHVALCLMALLVGPGAAQEGAQPGRSFAVPPEGETLRIDRIEDIPPQLRAATQRAGCRLDDMLMREYPIEIFRPAAGSRPMALVICESIVAYSRAFVFERGTRDEPLLLRFPAVIRPQGFTASEHVGVMNWNAETKTITATQTTDICGAAIARHTYRHDSKVYGSNGFVLVRVESGPVDGCGPNGTEWKVLWEAAPWVILN